jgi:hypothetical protein
VEVDELARFREGDRGEVGCDGGSETPQASCEASCDEDNERDDEPDREAVLPEPGSGELAW